MSTYDGVNATKSSGCQLLWPQQQVCSGNGDCLLVEGETVPRCFCYDGYTSIGDFAVDVNVDCDINITAIIVLNCIPLSISIILIIICLHYYISRYLCSGNNTEKVNFIPFCAIISGFTTMGYSVSRIMYPANSGVGATTASTVFLGLAYFITWLCQGLFVLFFSNMLIVQAKMNGEDFRRKALIKLQFLKRSVFMIVGGNLIWAFMLLLPLYHQNTVNIAAGFHYVGAAFNMALIGYYVFPTSLKPLRDDIRKVLKEKNVNINEVKKRLKEIKDMNLKEPSSEQITLTQLLAMSTAESNLTKTIKFLSDQVVQQFFVAAMFGLWPFFIRKTSYQLPVTYIGGQVALCLEVITVSNLSFNRKRKNITPPEMPNEPLPSSNPSSGMDVRIDGIAFPNASRDISSRIPSS